MVLASLASVRKYYSSTATLAVDGADFSIEAGEVHALVGENGAGKSTLARMLCGFETPDSGTIEVRGKPVRFYSHRDAERAGIGFVPQYSMLAAGLSAAENVAMGHEPARLGIFSDKRRAAYEFSMLADRYGFDVDPDAAISSLSAAARREVEILRAIIGRLKAAGAGIVYISHRARELLDLADRISVMRYGKVEKTIRADEIDECGLADLIVTRGSCSTGPVNGGTPGAIAISIRGVSLAGRGEDSLDAVDLAVRSGEIVSVVALGGNGLDSLEEVAAGLVRPDVGDVMVLGKAIGDWKPQELRTRVMAYLPTDREGRGLCPRASVGSNVIARKLFRYTFAEFAIGDAPRTDAGAMLGKFGVGNWRRRRVDSMSGGNRQRVVAARELEGFSPLVIAANPAQGLDPAARAALFGRLSELRDQGAAILLLTSDPEDASDLADKVFALYRGRLRQLDSKSGDPSGLAAAITGAAS
jgi:simple sugar transport system ATP-binding protein